MRNLTFSLAPPVTPETEPELAAELRRLRDVHGLDAESLVDVVEGPPYGRLDLDLEDVRSLLGE